jgi:hypothetical protein
MRNGGPLVVSLRRRFVVDRVPSIFECDCATRAIVADLADDDTPPQWKRAIE